MIKKYIAYFKNNPEGYWFKAKIFGWGWTPVTWQGWLITIIFVLMIYIISVINKAFPSFNNDWPFVLAVIVLAGAFIFIAYKKGEKPSWRWGIPKDKNK